MRKLKKRAQKLGKLKYLAELEKKQISERASEKRLAIKSLDDLIEEAFKAEYTPANQTCLDFIQLADKRKLEIAAELNMLLEEALRCHRQVKKFEKLSSKVSEKIKTEEKKSDSKFLDSLTLLKAAWQKTN